MPSGLSSSKRIKKRFNELCIRLWTNYCRANYIRFAIFVVKKTKLSAGSRQQVHTLFTCNLESVHAERVSAAISAPFLLVIEH